MRKESLNKLHMPSTSEQNNTIYETVLFGSDRSPRRGDLVRACVCVSGILFKIAVKMSSSSILQSRGQASKQAGKQADKQAGKQAKRQAKRQAGKKASRQASTNRKAFCRSHALEGLVKTINPSFKA